MDRLRDRPLDNLCESIAEHRSAKNNAATGEVSDIQAALQRMQAKGWTVYKHGGVELARVPGAEKLRVRLTKETGDADAGDLVPEGEDSALDQAGEDLITEAFEDVVDGEDSIGGPDL